MPVKPKFTAEEVFDEYNISILRIMRWNVENAKTSSKDNEIIKINCSECYTGINNLIKILPKIQADGKENRFLKQAKEIVSKFENWMINKLSSYNVEYVGSSPVYTDK